MAFKEWLTTLLVEKQLYENDVQVVDPNGFEHYYDMPALIAALDVLPVGVKQQIKRKLVYIDFKNGDVMHFMRYLAVGLVTL